MTEDILKTALPKYLTMGEDKFYRFLLTYAINKLVVINQSNKIEPFTGTPPDLQLLGYHERFVILYRREGNEAYLEIARLCRKAAHKIYRLMLKNGMTVPNAKFLNLVSLCQ